MTSSKDSSAQLAAIPARSGALFQLSVTFAIAIVLIGGWYLLVRALPHGAVRDTFDGSYQHMTVFLLLWHLLILGFRAVRVWWPEVKAMREIWLPGSDALTTEGVAEAAQQAYAWEAHHGTSLITRRIILCDSHLNARGDSTELSNLLERRAEADRGRTEDAYALPRFLFWAIPILGFIGTVVGIGGAIAGLKTGDITSAEVLRDQIGNVAGSLGTAFYATQVALILSVIALLAQTVLYQSEMSLHDNVEDLLTYQLEGRLSIETPDQAGMTAAIKAFTTEISKDSERREQAAQAHVQALITGHEQLGSALTELTTRSAEVSTAAQRAHRQIAQQATELSEAVSRALEAHVVATNKELGWAATGLVKTLAEERERWHQAATVREKGMVDIMAKSLAEVTTPLASLIEQSMAQVEKTIQSLQASHRGEVAQQTERLRDLHQILTHVQEAVRQLPPAIQELRKPIQMQFTLAPIKAE